MSAGKRPMRLEIYRAATTAIEHYANGLRVYRDGRLVFRVGWRWRIRATNGRILADSGEAYQRLRDCAHGAGLVTGINLDLAGVKPGDDFPRYPGLAPWRITVES